MSANTLDMTAERPATGTQPVQTGKIVLAPPAMQAARERPEPATPETSAFMAERVCVWFGQRQVLHDITMSISQKTVTAIIGPSGCGKSTFLRSLNRMHELVPGARLQGTIRLFGENIYGAGIDPAMIRRRVGMVFQKSNPFPTMTIAENVTVGLRLNGVRDRDELEERTKRALQMAALWDEVSDRLHRPATSLSGGQQQRLCIARAIAMEPEVILMDEPASALDPIATQKIEDLLQILKNNYTIVIVTHNMQQAARTSDYTAFMYMGRLMEYGPTATIFQNPRLPETLDYVTGRFG